MPVAPDPTIAVQLDESDRITRVEIERLPDEVREPVALNAAFQDAVTDAMAARRPAAPDVLDADGRPRASRVTRPARRPLRELVEESIRHADLHRDRSLRPVLGGERGVSDNDYVTVVLDRTGPGGQLDVDGGWIRNAEPKNVAAAIEQGFAAAYTERERR